MRLGTYSTHSLIGGRFSLHLTFEDPNCHQVELLPSTSPNWSHQSDKFGSVFTCKETVKTKMNLFSPFRRGSMLPTGIWWNCRRCTSIFRTACRLWADALGQFALNSHWHFGALKRDLSASHETSTGNMRLLWKCLLSLDSEMFMICFLLWSLGFSWHNLWELKLQPFRLRWSHDRCLPSAVRLLGAQRLRKSCVMADKPGQT